MELDYEVRDINDPYSYPPFILDLWDEDKELFDRTDDFLGRAMIEPEDCNLTLQKEFENDRSKEIPSEPRWHPIKFQEGEPACGEILVSFAVAETDYNFMAPSPASVDLKSTVEFKDFDVTMLILGLRNLESPGILPVKKAYIQFNVKSLVPPDSIAMSNLVTKAGPTGPNPTLNTTIEFNIPLPTKPLYCPKLSCFVYDNIFMGMSQAQIGTFTLEIGQMMLDLKKERFDELQEIENIIMRLHEISKTGTDFEPKSYNAFGDGSSGHGS